ncbi:hypothetical protein [Kitasatospora acidiphila]|nr:hypothetical protein [Kitasatospora acidiphila]
MPGLRGHEVFLCGPPEMMATTVRELRAAGVPQHLIHHESFEF